MSFLYRNFLPQLFVVLFLGLYLSKGDQYSLHPLIQVFQVVGKRAEQDGYPELRRDVEENGFIKPIVIIENTFENYNLAIRRVTKRFVREYINAHRVYLCMYGNQRIDIALDLRIFYLNAILAPNVEWAHAIQLKLDAKPLKPTLN